jgi:aspartyl/asparaginyl-tRNA synthetase
MLTDPSSTDEKILGNIVREKYKTDFYILKEYPLAARAFYTMPSAKDPKYSHSYDFMLRGQEVLSGAQRVHDPALLRSRIKALGIDPDGPGLKDYVQTFAYGEQLFLLRNDSSILLILSV